MLNQPTIPNNKQPKKNNKQHQILLFSGMAFEMFAIIGIGVFLGNLFDKKIPNSFHLGIIVGSLLGLTIAFYQVYRKFTNTKNTNE